MNKYDIGGEIISILTKGMYPDPKDALREYIQNGVDAFAKNINLKVRQDSIVIEDDGIGMNHEVLRKAIRVGISEKNPTEKVGFMGIGIYSSFHLCDKLSIFSRGDEDVPNKLEMDFGGMRAVLADQKEKRLKDNIKADELVDLQTLLEQFITLSNNNTILSSAFPNRGTRIELVGLETEFYTALSNFEEVAEYLRNVIPLHFNSKKFTYAEEIEKKITEICQEYDQNFEIINLKLQINSRIEVLYRPYTDNDFNRDEKLPLAPKFETIQNGVFYGVVWGCLNSVRRKVENKNLRGFILKKQGFSIGRRDSMVKYFQRRNTFFDRYSGEIIIVNPNIIPNASRSELEYSPLRSNFYDALTEVTKKYDAFAHQYQEYTKGDDEISDLNEELKAELGSFNENEGSPDVIVNRIVKLNNIIDRLKARIDNKSYRPEIKNTVESLLEQATNLEGIYKERLKTLTEAKKSEQVKRKSALQIAKNLSNLRIEQTISKTNYESLYDLFKDMEFNIDDELKEVIYLIDEKFVQKDALTREQYYVLLNELREEILALY